MLEGRRGKDDKHLHSYDCYVEIQMGADERMQMRR